MCTDKASITSSNKLCANCKTWNNISLSSPNFFMKIDLKYQIELLLKRDIVVASLSKSFQKRKNQTKGVKSDVNDGEMLSQHVHKENENVMTLNINTDGVQIFSNSKRSLWPLQVMMNDLEFRCRCKNILLAGIMIVSKEPNHDLMNLFMGTFVNQLQTLNDAKLSFRCSESNEIIVLNFALACVCVDSVARPIVQNRLRFSGFFGSSYCYNKGQSIAGSMRYLTKEKNCEIRTHESHLIDLNVVEQTQSTEKSRGVKGHCALMSEAYFDMV